MYSTEAFVSLLVISVFHNILVDDLTKINMVHVPKTRSRISILNNISNQQHELSNIKLTQKEKLVRENNSGAERNHVSDLGLA